MTVDNLQWLWVVAAVFLAIGELLTAGFFLLPFAVGAVVAAILAFLGVGLIWQLLAFVVVSIGFLALLQHYVRRADEDTAPAEAGANRYQGREAIVIEAIDPKSGSGMVRMGTEEWRAKADPPRAIDELTAVRVTGVSGTFLVVQPIGDGDGASEE